MKKTILIAPLLSLAFLASCGGNEPEPEPGPTHEIDFETFIELAESNAEHFNCPDSYLVEYDNNPVINGVTYENFGPKYSANKNKFYVQEKYIDFEYDTNEEPKQLIYTTYWVPNKEHTKLWILNKDSNDNYDKYEYQDSLEEDYQSILGEVSYFTLLSNFEPYTISGIVGELEGFKEEITSGEIDFHFYADGEKSLKFKYEFKNAVYQRDEQHKPITLNGGEVLVIQDGLMYYAKGYGNTLDDFYFYMNTNRLTETNTTLRYKYNCEVEIPEEANPETWPE